MGGDGDILTALREYAGTGVPVFAVNFGEVGFLATIDPDGLDADFDRAFAGDFETLELPGITVGRPQRARGRRSTTSPCTASRGWGRRPRLRARGGGDRPACAATASSSSTPQGSTGYNLANGGPVLAWGVEGSWSRSSRRTR